MKKIIISSSIAMVIGFIGGLCWEHTATQNEIDEMVQITQEACDMRIKTLKYACKK